MSSIPLYDATAPITCTITGEEIPHRVEVAQRMHDALERIERTEHGMLLHFPNRPDIEADVREFAVDEKRCCQFWGFAVTSTAEELTLRWDAPPAADEVVERLMAYFEGDEPITAVSGLL